MTAIPRSRYSLVIFIISLIIWGYSLSWAVVPDAWWFLLRNCLHLDRSTIATIFGVMVLVLMVVSWMAVLTHIAITLYRPFRKQYSPRWFSHIAALAILWLALGSLVTVCERKFPYIQKATDTGVPPTQSP
jgi:hypothetical protein